MAIKFELEEYHRNISDDELLSDLKRVASELQKPSITGREYKERGKYGKNTVANRFGSWNKALERAGLNKSITRNIIDEELFQNLEDVWTKLAS